MTRILVVDNYDSFVYTLNGYVQQLGAQTDVVRNDAFPESEIADRLAEYDGVLLSPGPGTPGDAGVSIATVHAAIDADKPLLGVCLGHQAIAEALGATVTHAEELMHGKTSQVDHDDSTLFAGVPHPFTATRYHSLAIVDGTVPDELTVTARTGGGVIMGVQHQDARVYGVQFHPESVLTEGGYRMVGNWLETTGLTGAADRAAGLGPLIASRQA
ncbi:anthranilate synthase component II [Curtobacterium sp. MMLR14_010]|jgi:para-aminobenzoate synthetase component 2|uniref:anthranilate synthase component II n=1 Tax=unclassified Curtobacterium TaxID=257496 RepID=UPI0008DD09FB|nr:MULTISPECIES: gamma-glutamyl-gamma-aminobutyrate hydrolase family protein [unclassified Curtobacterium]MBF4582391.1 gamma-glutamyl-gamma-aminobutyrate hydrolase family protein [Curtobacterium sp. VKM Ac-2865]MBF4588771.1 gamma-glutamyl-gamma-aminobutyrate hydrolase family protein [Curtobacterium sp. VKM Ac-1395]MCY1693588.1 gamma-glutamyl-gamma-aminobutyrate hydrolase family protein [Curtobacterium sp. SL109]OII31631.1 anthranilate synthase component II [Curtobacterium sp. MMLR14_010]